jgi:hypothetical protein
MGWSDVATILALLAFMWVCDWAVGPSKWRKRVVIFAGFCLYIMGCMIGADSAKKVADRDAQQSTILTDRSMPR